MKQRRLLLISLGLLALWLSGCRSVLPLVKIGLVAPFSGAGRAIGYDVIYSARLAVREINAQGGIGGARVMLVAHDDFGDPTTAIEIAAALALDPDVFAVAGHWLPATTAAAAPVYADNGLALLRTGNDPFGEFPPDQLPQAFSADYAAVTPFDEVAGPYAGTAYDAVHVIMAAFTRATQEDGRISRDTVRRNLSTITHSGVTGTITLP